MKRFLLIREQGGGCDHTIGCGIDYHIFKAKNIEAAYEWARDKCLEYYTPEKNSYSRWFCEWEIKKAKLFEITSPVDLPVSGWNENHIKRIESDLADAKETKERDELKRLKAKYEK